MESLQVFEKGQLARTMPTSDLTRRLRSDFFSFALHSMDGKLSVNEIREFVRSKVLKQLREISLRLDAHLGSSYGICRREATALLGRINYSVAYSDDQPHTDRSFYMKDEVRKEVINFLECVSDDSAPRVNHLLDKTVDYLRAEKENLEKNIYGSQDVLDERAESASLIMRVLRLNMHYSELYNKYNDESFSDTLDLFRNETLIRNVLCAGDIELALGNKIDAGLVGARLRKICELSNLAIKAVYSTSFDEVSSCVIDIRTSFEITSGFLLRTERGQAVVSSLCGN